MKKLFTTLLVLSLMAGVSAQNVKCGIDTKALMGEEVAAGATTLKFLAKMAPGYETAVLEKAGIKIGAKAGDIVTLTVPVESLGILESCKDVLQYSISHHVAGPDCDKMRYDTRTDKVQAGIGVEDGMHYEGVGVYIGITDWGFDYRHPNYNNQKPSNYRVAMAWDHFRKSGPAPAGFDYGTVISGYDNLIAAKGDTANFYNYATHGTHVAGIAAGYGIHETYRGQAYKARLLFCTFGLGEAEWMEGVSWMKQVAQDSARRLVVNNSWGMYTFSCIDGHSLLSQAINNWSNEGVVFCTSAGNNGDVNFHIKRNFAEFTDTLRTVANYYGSSEAVGQALILWGEEGLDFEAGFRMAGDGVVYASPMFSTAAGDTVIYDSLLCGDSYVTYRAMIEHSNPFDSRPHIQMDVEKKANCELRLYIIADTGTVHAWNVVNLKNHAGNMGCEFSKSGHGGFTKGDPYYGIGEPACAAKCISVAAHTSERLMADSVTLVGGYAAQFSSYGPLIDGSQKPEISAPGVNVISSIRTGCTDFGNYTPSETTNVQGEQFIWSKMSGTSMSCPSVTGVVALILQANPLLSVDQVRDIITTNARNDDYTGPLQEHDSTSVRWGWGKVDALKCVNDAVHRVSIQDAEELRLPLQVYPNPVSNIATVLTGCGESQTMTVYSVDGRTVFSQQVQEQATIDLTTWNNGIYIVKVGSRTAKIIKKQ